MKHLSSNHKASVKQVPSNDQASVKQVHMLHGCLVLAWQMLCVAWQMLEGMLDKQLSCIWHAAQSICQALDGNGGVVKSSSQMDSCMAWNYWFSFFQEKSKMTMESISHLAKKKILIGGLPRKKKFDQRLPEKKFRSRKSGPRPPQMINGRPLSQDFRMESVSIDLLFPNQEADMSVGKPILGGYSPKESQIFFAIPCPDFCYHTRYAY